LHHALLLGEFNIKLEKSASGEVHVIPSGDDVVPSLNQLEVGVDGLDVLVIADPPNDPHFEDEVIC
jgi:hypothetical protein